MGALVSVMLSALLDRLARALLRAPLLFVLAAALPTLGLAALGSSMPRDLSFTGLMDRNHPEVQRYLDTVERFALGGTLTLLLEGPEERLPRVLEELRPVLENNPSVRAVMTEAPIAWLLDYAAYWVPDDVFDRWLGLATRPDDLEGAARLADDFRSLEREAKRLQRENLRLIFVTLKSDALDLSVGGADVLGIERDAKAILAAHPDVTLELAGLPAIVTQDQVKTMGTVQRLTPLTLLLVLLLFRLIDRNVLRLISVALPMVLAIGAALGVTGWALGTLTVMETFFGIMVLGLGVDFALHLLVRLREERGRGHDFETALRRTLRGTGTGVVAGAITTVGAFFLVALAPDPAARHLGVSGGIGLLFCLALMLTLLPACWVLLEKHTRYRLPRRASNEVWLRAVHGLAQVSARYPRPVLAISLGIWVVALLGTPRFTFETNLEKVFNRQVPAVQATARLQEIAGLGSAPWFVAVPTLEEAYEVAERFARDPTFGHVDSATRYVRQDRHERAARLRAAADEIETQKTVLGALALLATDDEKAALERGSSLLDLLQKASALGPPELQALPPILRTQLLGPRNEVLIFAYAKTPSFDARDTAKQRIAARAIAPESTAMAALLEMMMGFDRPWLFPIFFAILFFVIGWLALDLRQARLVVLAMAPVVLAVGITFGVLCWAGVGFSLITALVIPLIIGLGVDDGIHVVHRLREDPDLGVDEATASVGRAILMTTATTCVSFSALMMTNHAGMESMGLVMLIGLPLCLLGSITTLPALAVVLGVARAPEDDG